MGFLKSLLAGMSKPDVPSLKNRNALIIDVREPYEYATGHIPGSLNVPLSQLAEYLDNDTAAFDTPILFCCQSGIRTRAAVAMARKARREAYNGRGWKWLWTQWQT